MNNDPDTMHKEMDEVEYPDDDDYDNQDPDVGGIPVAARPTIITDDEKLEEVEEDRSNNADEYKGDWTNELSHEDNQDDSEEEYESRSNPKDLQPESESNVGEDDVQVNMESSEEEDPIENDTVIDQEQEIGNRGSNTRPRRANTGTGVTRLELSSPEYQGTVHSERDHEG